MSDIDENLTLADKNMKAFVLYRCRYAKLLPKGEKNVPADLALGASTENNVDFRDVILLCNCPDGIDIEFLLPSELGDSILDEILSSWEKTRGGWVNNEYYQLNT